VHVNGGLAFINPPKSHPHPLLGSTTVCKRDTLLGTNSTRFVSKKMPADIRSFFGGGPPKGSQDAKKKDEPAPKKAAPKKKGRASRVVEDSDDDDEEEAK
jgi:hypothetical protein